MVVGWHHPEDASDQWDGFNEPGIEHFRSNPLLHLAREIIQNAIDARNDTKLLVHFRLREVDVSSIPNLDELQENFKHCLFASKTESDNAQVFFKNALKKLSNKTIKVLEASDYNTYGMRGPSKNGTPFFAFMKAKGQSKKDVATASGSYGIGKFAPYAASELRTVFVSTIYQDESGVCRQLSQGKSILMSHDVDGERRQGVGFWGIKKKCQPVEGHNSLPEWFVRSADESAYTSNQGSKISIIGFDDVENWRSFLAVSVAENFFAAIAQNELAVHIDDDYVLDAGFLPVFFTDPVKRTLLASELNNEPEQFDNAYNYYSALSDSEDVIIEHKEHYILGLCTLRIIVAEGLPKKVCALRNGMFISDYINGLKRFSDYKDFVAVFQCESEKGNKLLRLMEPPKHDNFEPNLLPTKDDQERGRKSLSGIAKWIREMLKKHARDPVSDVTPLDELKEFFGDEGENGSGDGTEEINPMGKLIIRAKPTRPALTMPPSGESQGQGEAGGEDEGGGGGGGKDGNGGGDVSGGKGIAPGGSGKGGGRTVRPVEILNLRAIVIGPRMRRLAFTPTSTGKLSVSICEAGADIDYNTRIFSTDFGKLDNGSIIVDCVSGVRLTFNIELPHDFLGAVKVVANEIR